MDSWEGGTQAMLEMSVRPREVPKMTGKIYTITILYYFEDVYFLLRKVEFANGMFFF